MNDDAVRAAVPPPAAWPTVDGVAALLRARTKDRNGNEVGTFSADTRPTATQVSAHIADAVQAVADELQADVPDTLYGSFAWCAKRYAACDIEKSYWPEQVASARSNYDQLWEQYLRAVEALKERLPGEVTDGSLEASGIGNLGLERPPGEWKACRLGSPPQFPGLECAVVNYDDPWD
jgi:hypothetical protein